jgi:hypothetical protein
MTIHRQFFPAASMINTTPINLIVNYITAGRKNLQSGTNITKVLTSPNGTRFYDNWVAPAGWNDFFGVDKVDYANGKWFILNNTQMAVSSDGLSWTITNFGASSNSSKEKLYYISNVYYKSSGQYLKTSNDGLNWTNFSGAYKLATSPFTNLNLTNLTITSNNKYLATSGPQIFYSDDATNWYSIFTTSAFDPSTIEYFGIAENPITGTFIAMCRNAGTFQIQRGISPTNWTNVFTTLNPNNGTDLCLYFDGNKFYSLDKTVANPGGGTIGAFLVSINNGLNFIDQAYAPASDQNILSFRARNGRYINGKYFMVGYNSIFNNPASVTISKNGIEYKVNITDVYESTFNDIAGRI